METFENWREKQHLWQVLGYFFGKKIFAESQRLLVDVYGGNALIRTQCFEWSKRFESGDFDIKDKQSPDQEK